jgi:hypothetical protein
MRCFFGNRQRPAGLPLRARKLAYNGRRQSVPAWARELKIAKNTIYKRLKLGWPIHLALSRAE